MAKFKPKDWVEIEDKALGLKAIGVVITICKDTNYRLYYSIDWRIIECNKTKGIQPTSLYSMVEFDKKGVSAQTAEVLYGKR